MNIQSTSLDANEHIAEANLLTLRKIFFAVLFSGLIGLLAQLKIYLPNTPIPITGQVFGILLAGVFLGSKTGSLSVLIYIVLGINGVPWFSAGASGVNVLTVGYIIGFLPAVFLTGFIASRFKKNLIILSIAVLSGVAVIYTCGATWFYFVFAKELGFVQLIQFAIVPFILFDIVKAAAVIAIFKLWNGVNSKK